MDRAQSADRSIESVIPNRSHCQQRPEQVIDFFLVSEPVPTRLIERECRRHV
jgi:hypothetical protein